MMVFDLQGQTGGRVHLRFEALRGCGAGVQHDDVQTRIMYKTSEVDGTSSSCESEEQTRTCEQGTWGMWSGTYHYTSCGSSCAPGCLASMRLDSECQPQCNVAACSFDNGICRVQMLAKSYEAKWMAFTTQRAQAINLLADICSDDNLNSADSVQKLVSPSAALMLLLPALQGLSPAAGRVPGTLMTKPHRPVLCLPDRRVCLRNEGAPSQWA